MYTLLASAGALLAQCLGPENYAGNAPVLKRPCEGDWSLSFAAYYWSAHQEGTEFAIVNEVPIPVINPTTTDIQQLNQLANAHYVKPTSHWQFGYRLGLHYATQCDGWDIGLIWTEYHNRSKKIAETTANVNSILSLWSAFSPVQGSPAYAREIEGIWKVKLTLLDLPLGRQYWVSRKLNIRPHIGLRYGRVSQDLDLQHRGGSWSPRIGPTQPPLVNTAKLDNVYKGTGLRGGLDSQWHYGCGFSVYGILAASVLYGRFRVAQKEHNHLAISPHTQENVILIKERLRGSRAILDLALGIQWSRQFFDCRFGVTTQFGWEQHHFFDQNQLWRIRRNGIIRPETNQIVVSSNTGQNISEQSRGSLDIQGWTLNFIFEY
ncbi:MAG: hypothetical protein JSS30_00535 [Verrucomicrobia bacterium]|nr:hypothetical protein [Verrucomicrobiota bacterium]